MTQQSIYSTILLDFLTPTSSRNIQNLEQSFDLSAESIIEEGSFILAANNSGHNNTSSTRTLSNIQAFVHLQFSNVVTLVLTQNSNSVTIVVDRIFHVAGAFTSIVVTNMNQTDYVQVKSIYA